MTLSREDVLRVAHLARLELAPDEIEPMVRDLASILKYVETLAEVDTTGVEPTNWIAVSRAPLRPDEVSAGVETETALAQAPRAGDAGFAVPAFVDEG
jgi:aspartyl-tRNA(Asn)/glutamyl-tRNA(Gln) amidotransferase subunit C